MLPYIAYLDPMGYIYICGFIFFGLRFSCAGADCLHPSSTGPFCRSQEASALHGGDPVPWRGKKKIGPVNRRRIHDNPCQITEILENAKTT